MKLLLCRCVVVTILCHAVYRTVSHVHVQVHVLSLPPDCIVNEM